CRGDGHGRASFSRIDSGAGMLRIALLTGRRKVPNVPLRINPNRSERQGAEAGMMPRRAESAGGSRHVGTRSNIVATGQLPRAELVRALVAEAYERFRSNTDGENSQVYAALARVPSDLFGVCVASTAGEVYAVGDAEREFSIMSVSKPFVFA